MLTQAYPPESWIEDRAVQDDRAILDRRIPKRMGGFGHYKPTTSA
jgi:hypothetical protein